MINSLTAATCTEGEDMRNGLRWRQKQGQTWRKPYHSPLFVCSVFCACVCASVSLLKSKLWLRLRRRGSIQHHWQKQNMLEECLLTHCLLLPRATRQQHIVSCQIWKLSFYILDFNSEFFPRLFKKRVGLVYSAFMHQSAFSNNWLNLMTVVVVCLCC